MKIKKTLFSITFILCTTLIITGCVSDSTKSDSNNEETITLKVATGSSEDSPFSNYAVKPFMEKVTELTDGQVEFDFYPSSQLGESADLLSLTQDGATDIAYFNPPYYPSEMPIGSSILGIPGLFNTSYEGSMAYNALIENEELPMLQRDFLDNGVRPVFAMMVPTYNLWTKGEEIKVPEDIKGMKIRASGGVTTEAMEFAGATPVSMDAADQYSAFDKGVIDGVHNYIGVLETFGVDDLIGYGTTDLEFGSVPIGLMINEDVWQDLPDDARDAMLQVREELAESASKSHDSEVEEIEAEYAETEDITLYEITGEEKEQWQEIFDEFAENYLSEKNDEDLNITLEAFKDEIENIK